MIAIILALLVSLTSGCDMSKTLANGLSQSEAVSKDLKEKTGIKPFVGFNWNNGSLTAVTVTFDGFPADKSFFEISDLAKQSIKTSFSQAPEHFVLSFKIKP